jgi:ATP-dependent Zn protease
MNYFKEITIMELPTGVTTMDYAGVHMNQERYAEIMAGLQDVDRLQLIGWRAIAGGSINV